MTYNKSETENNTNNNKYTRNMTNSIDGSIESYASTSSDDNIPNNRSGIIATNSVAGIDIDHQQQQQHQEQQEYEYTDHSSPTIQRTIQRARTSPSSCTSIDRRYSGNIASNNSNTSPTSRRFSLRDHPGFVMATNKMIRGSKSTTDLNVSTELVHLANKLRAGSGLGLNGAAVFERSFTGVVSVTSSSQATTAKSLSSTASSVTSPTSRNECGNNTILEEETSHGIPHLPNLRTIGAALVNSVGSVTTVFHPQLCDKQAESQPQQQQDPIHHLHTVTPSVPENKVPSLVLGPSSKQQSFQSNTGTSFNNDTSSLFRLAIVVSDCETLLHGNYNVDAIAAIANPVSKCQLVTVCVLNKNNNNNNKNNNDNTGTFGDSALSTGLSPDSRKVVEEWIHTNYIVSLRRHRKYVVNGSSSRNRRHDQSTPIGTTTTESSPSLLRQQRKKHQPTENSSSDNNSNLAQTNHTKFGYNKLNLDYHSNMVLYPDDLDELDGDDDTNHHRNNNFTNTYGNYDDNDDQTMIRVDIVTGDDGFQRLLRANGSSSTFSSIMKEEENEEEEDDDNENDASSRPAVDGIYFIVPDPNQQHQYAMEALRYKKHILLNDPASTSLTDFCEEFVIAKAVNRFVQFSTMFVNQYRVKRFLECVTSSETFGRIQSIEAILNVNYDDVHKIDPAYNQQAIHDCVKRLGRYCVLISTLMLCRVALFRSTVVEEEEQQPIDEEEHVPLSAQVTSYTISPYKVTNTVRVASGEDGKEEYNEGTTVHYVPSSATCVVHFTNQRMIQFTVQYSSAPTRQVLTVRCGESGRYATMSDFVIPHPDGLSNCRLYDAVRKMTLPTTDDDTKTNDTGIDIDVVCAEAVDMPSGPPQNVVMWRRFCELSRSIEQEGWEIMKEEAEEQVHVEKVKKHSDADAAAAVEVSGSTETNSYEEVDKGRSSIGLDVDKSRHDNILSTSMSVTQQQQPLLYQHFDSFNSAISNNVGQQTQPTLYLSQAALDAQEARDYTDVSIQTKCILMALTESWQRAEKRETTMNVSNSLDCSQTNNNNKKKVGEVVRVDIPKVW